MIGILIGNRQAAFLVDAIVLGRIDDLRIDENARVADGFAVFIFLFLKVNNEQALGHTDLHCGEANAGGSVHCFKHIGDERAHVIVNALNRRRNLAQERIGRLKDGKNGHM
jgi:hypothetical protein